MEFHAPLNRQPARLQNGVLVIDDGFSVEKTVKAVLDITSVYSFPVTLFLPYAVKGHQLRLDVQPGEDSECLAQRILDILRETFGDHFCAPPYPRRVSQVL